MIAPKPGDLRVWYVPNPPATPWRTPVKNLGEALLVLNALERIGAHRSQSGVIRWESDGDGAHRWFDIDDHELTEVAAALAA
jgi:hypothetical protein